MNYELLLKDAEAYVSKYIRKHDNPKLLFHNLNHIQNIVLVSGQIAEYYSLNEKELFIVKAAAWFVYTGYYKDYLNPAETSANIAEDFFTGSGLDNETIDLIKKCILVTVPGSAPGSLPEEIVYDTNSFYFGTENFSSYNKLRRKEFDY